MSRVLRCAGCAKRIRGHHPHIGLLDVATEREIPYHVRCQGRAAGDFAAMAERGKVYILRHHHSSRCPDKVPGFGCAGGCFDEAPLAVAN